MNFQDCINENFNGFSGSQTQHSFIVDFLIPTMVEIFQDIKSFIITPAQINEAENPTNGAIILYSPMGSPPTASANVIPWNWNDFSQVLVI